MALGIDIYRYQKVTDWAAVKRAGVSFVYVKGTDGGGQAPVHADSQVAGAKSAGLPVGLYHYAELSPSAETQADVLAAEVNRLGATGMPPALDLEGAWTGRSDARSFAIRFLTRLKTHFPVVTLYANTSMLSAIGADMLGISNVRIWAANYGPNDGHPHTFSYGGRVDIHQYTSVGHVPGITGSVDMNESFTPTPVAEDDMQANEPVIDPRTGDSIGPFTDVTFYTNYFVNMIPSLHAKLDAIAGALTDDEANIIAAVRAQPTGGQVDVDDLAARLTASLPPGIAAELGRRLVS